MFIFDVYVIGFEKPLVVVKPNIAYVRNWFYDNYPTRKIERIEKR